MGEQPPIYDEETKTDARQILQQAVPENSTAKDDVLGQQDLDPVLNAKMRLVNDAIDEIGFTPYQAKLFVLSGFGYAVDSMLLVIQSIIAPYAAYEFQSSFDYGLTVAVYVGMLVGALFWGLSADMIGRRHAFNYSLLIASIFCIVAGASPNWIVLGLFTCLSAFGCGGNLVLDTTVFLEQLPRRSCENWFALQLAHEPWMALRLVRERFARLCNEYRSCYYGTLERDT
jgi:hypothetical protein